MLDDMPTRKPAATKPTARTKPAAEERPNALAEAATEAQRKVLLAALKRHRWNLAHTSEALRLSGAPAVIQYLKRLGLTDEYAAAKADGRIRRLLDHYEKIGLIVVRTDFSGRRSVSIPELGLTTEPLDA